MSSNKPASPVFTVFTPTYNREATLPYVYSSLVSQTFTDFEWLIVDDGSTDQTEELVKLWQQQGVITIRYWRQPNQGKHVAFNFAVSKALGTLLTVLDSDDTCVPRALERFYYHWSYIPESMRSQYSGVTCLCMDPNSQIIGMSFPSSPLDASPIHVHHKLCISGEKWGFQRVDVLRLYPYPVINGEKFCPEGLVWNRIGTNYLIRFVNEPLRTYTYSPDGLSANGKRILYGNPVAMSTYYRELANLPVGWLIKIRALLHYGRTAPGVNGSLLSALLAAPLGVFGKVIASMGTIIYLVEQKQAVSERKSRR